METKVEKYKGITLSQKIFLITEFMTGNYNEWIIKTDSMYKVEKIEDNFDLGISRIYERSY